MVALNTIKATEVDKIPSIYEKIKNVKSLTRCRMAKSKETRLG